MRDGEGQDGLGLVRRYAFWVYSMEIDGSSFGVIGEGREGSGRVRCGCAWDG